MYATSLNWLLFSFQFFFQVGTRGSLAMLIYAGATSSSPLQDMWVFRPDDESWVEIEAVLDTPFAREGHATVMLKPKAATLRRRRLLMDGPGDVDISSGVRDTFYMFFGKNIFCFVYGTRVDIDFEIFCLLSIFWGFFQCSLGLE